MELKEKLVEFCKNLGFDLVGIIEPEPLKERLEVLVDRHKKGYNSNFENKDISLRISPHLLLPGIKSILVLGLGYYPETHFKDPSKAQVARYARGKDYHLVMREKMTRVVEFLKTQQGDFQYKILVDSSPLVERFLAEKTGLGWIGQNTCFYTKATGSWIFIGEILLTIDLGIYEANSISDGCHNCHICIKACPTGALEGEYTLNPHKCLAYVSQARGVIPRELRKLMRHNLVGCDICQEVCPNNRGLLPGGNEDFKTMDFHNIDIKDILGLSNTDFKRLYAGSAFGWCGKKVLQRNAIVVLGNQKQPEAISLIKPFLNHHDYKMRIHAAWALGQIGGSESKLLLEKRMGEETNLQVANEIKEALDKIEQKTPNYI